MNRAIPKTVLLPRINVREVINQGRAGSCAGCAARQAVYMLTKKLGTSKLAFYPPHLYIYYKTREKMGTVKQDSGSYLREIMKTLVDGVPEYKYHPYNDQWKIAPSQEAIDNAAFKLTGYQRIPIGLPNTAETVRRVIAKEGLPVLVGCRVYNDAMKRAGRTGKMPMPDSRDWAMGGHAMLITGYTSGKFQLLNSWGPWGNDGYFYMDEEYIADRLLTFDLWTFPKKYW